MRALRYWQSPPPSALLVNYPPPAAFKMWTAACIHIRTRAVYRVEEGTAGPTQAISKTRRREWSRRMTRSKPCRWIARGLWHLNTISIPCLLKYVTSSSTQ